MQTKSGFIAIVGRPNVGKSSLMNALVGEKIAIVSDKPQTTRNRITGVLTRGETQLVFLDTPGVHKSRTKLGDYMNRQVTSSVADVDLIVFVTEATVLSMRRRRSSLPPSGECRRWQCSTRSTCWTPRRRCSGRSPR